MAKKQKKESFAANKITLTNTPVDEEITVSTETSSRDPFNTNKYYPGDSVNEHKEIEEMNLDLAKEELKQQNENNALD
ncbi:hypothetical protein MM300_11875 [Evansella sp. LMS18]|uniref:hypothetical protein n=1 Tax=Evansella sp. LMS18 TaxID=2924033 RepID=UPI0020CFEB5A|nr:hypothetical protein [Evansella sp. LMS18]UTR08658.1 hypothetical protein MM300_11875 [Evansella sp. LMS18]